MKPAERLKAALHAIARREVPETVNLWPQLATYLEQKESKIMQPSPRVLWMILLVLLALALVSGAAYALYNAFKGDAGLEAVSQAGLLSEQNVTALPTPLPTPTPLPPAVPLGEAQTLQGVTIRLDWVYLDELWQAIGFSVSGLTEEQRLGLPQFDFGEVQPEQYRGAGMSLFPSESGLKGRYVVYQLVRDMETYMVAQIITDVAITIPLLDQHGNPLDTFRFTATQVRVNQAPYGGGNTYAVRYSGGEMRLEWVISSPQETRAKLCYQQPGTPTLKLKAYAGPQAEQNTAAADAPSSTPQQVIETTAPEGWQCVEAVFAPLSQEAQSFDLSIESLKDAAGKDIPGALDFVWSELPWQRPIPGIDPLPSQTVGEIKITLLQAYVDALRAAVVFRVEGLPSGAFYDLQLTDSEGKPFVLGGGGMSSDESDPNVFSATFTFAKRYNRKADDEFFSPREQIVNGRFVGKLKIIFDPWDAQGGQVFTFDLDVPAYPALVFTPAQSILSEGMEMRLERLEVTPSFTRAFLCYQKPSPADWMLSHEMTTLQLGQAQAILSEYAIAFDEEVGMSERPAWATLSGKVRCVAAGFAVGHHGRPETLQLTVNELEQSIPEVIPDAQLQAAKEKLRQQGIELDWVSFSANGGGGSGLQIKQKPQDMSDMEVMRLFYAALGYYFPGNWTFGVEIQP